MRTRSRVREAKRLTGRRRGKTRRAERSARDTSLRNTGISLLGDVPWGTHVCVFYETKQDVLDTVAAYFQVPRCLKWPT